MPGADSWDLLCRNTLIRGYLTERWTQPSELTTEEQTKPSEYLNPILIYPHLLPRFPQRSVPD